MKHPNIVISDYLHTTVFDPQKPHHLRVKVHLKLRTQIFLFFWLAIKRAARCLVSPGTGLPASQILNLG